MFGCLKVAEGPAHALFEMACESIGDETNLLEGSMLVLWFKCKGENVNTKDSWM